MHLNALHPQLYASIAYHLVANMTVMPPQLVVRLLRSLKEFKVCVQGLMNVILLFATDIKFSRYSSLPGKKILIFTNFNSYDKYN